MESRRSGPGAPLLVRSAGPADEQDVAALLRDVPIAPREVADLIRQRAALVLSDVTLPPPALPTAAAAFRLDRPVRTADLAGLGVHWALRRQGLGRRLLTGALIWLRVEGVEHVRARAEPGGAGAALLSSVGFATDGQAALAGGRACFVLFL